MPHKVCPWWLGYWLLCPVRGWLQKPGEILAPYVRRGMTVLEPGPGMGFFTLELAERVGPSGRVVCVDVQQQMLERLRRRASKSGVLERLELRLAPTESMGIADLEGLVDFVLAFAVVHEFPDARKFFEETATVLKTNATMLLAEPRGHVNTQRFESELQTAQLCGFTVEARPMIRRSHAAVLRKP